MKVPLAKIKVGDFSDIDAAEGFSDYSGPTPPKGVYLFEVKKWWLVENKNSEPMFKIIFEIAEDKGSEKAKYNGYAVWHYANITEKSAPFLNAMLDALGISRKAVYASKIVLSQEKEDLVVKIGSKAVAGLEVLINTKREEWPKDSDEWRLKAASFAEATGRSVVTKDEDDTADDGDTYPDADGDEVSEGDGPEAEEDSF